MNSSIVSNPSPEKVNAAADIDKDISAEKSGNNRHIRSAFCGHHSYSLSVYQKFFNKLDKIIISPMCFVVANSS